jgi:hypothetical protein
MSTKRKVPVTMNSFFCFSTVSADVESPEFCLGLQTLLSLKVRYPHLGLTQNAGKKGGKHGRKHGQAEEKDGPLHLCFQRGSSVMPKRNKETGSP